MGLTTDRAGGEAMAPQAGDTGGSTPLMSPRAMVVSWGLVGGFALVLAAGYGTRASWAGFEDAQDRQLWNLLHLLLLPAVLTTLPLWFRTRARWRRTWYLLFGLVTTAFAILVVGGYDLGWSWTGFQGNRLWDWLELLALPVVVALLPLWFETRRRLETRWRLALGLLGGAFAVTVVGGYTLGWRWTGFGGNTLLDWVHLLFVPFVLPASIAWYSTRVRFRAEEAEAEAAGAHAVAAEAEVASAEARLAVERRAAAPGGGEPVVAPP